MKFQEIQKMATGMGIPVYRAKKTGLIRAIQRAEENMDCYGTERVENCEEPACLWRSDCSSLNHRP